MPVYFWKKTPFARVLLFLVLGIIVQWYGQLPVLYAWLLLCTGMVLLTLLFFLPFFQRFRLSWLSGAGLGFVFAALGALLTWKQDIRHDKNWMGHQLSGKVTVIATISEPLVEKAKSFKANAEITYLLQGDKRIPVKGRIILYFKKDSALSLLKYGSQLVFNRPLQEIKNAGNPGGFNYQRYSLFQGISHQVYLTPQDYSVLPSSDGKPLQQFLFDTRNTVLDILRKYIEGSKETGLAEALLIGYKDDLDKTLVQSYTNTGVVHIIAISGLHLGLIYGLLVLLLKPLRRHRYVHWLGPLIIVAGLWFFALLTGAQPSILRSAVMFTCIVLAENLSRRSSIYNTLAFSAFLLLCYNPFWLWDVGFQLSYSAVLSIVIFMRPVYQLFYIQNKWLDLLWKLNAVTLAAQILTLPVSIYYFHQFPTHFLLTNLVAVPLSSAVLLGEIVLCAIAFWPWLASLTGQGLSWLIRIMNGYIEKVEQLPFSLWEALQVSVLQAILLTGCIAAFAYWWLGKNKRAFITGMVVLLAFFALRTVSFWQSYHQRKIIVYNIPQHQAIDFVAGRHFSFVGDTSLAQDVFARNFHLKPSRILHRISPVDSLPALTVHRNYLSFYNKRILLLDSSVAFSQPEQKQTIDLLVLSGNPKLYIGKIAAGLAIRQVVFDGSVPLHKLGYWKKDCDSLGIPWYDVAQKGAFVMNLP